MGIDLALLSSMPLAVAWFVKSGPIKEGHEALTKAAARGLSSTDLSALTKGVRSPDVDGPLTNHIKLEEQRRHALRRTLVQTTKGALGDATKHLAKLHGRVIGAKKRSRQLQLAGEALHLIQDSFSPAHAERSGRKIKKLRNFGPANWALPTPLQHLEHITPIDPRDVVRDRRGNFTREAKQAIQASTEYLTMVKKHTGGPVPGPEVNADLAAFVTKWLSRSRG